MTQTRIHDYRSPRSSADLNKKFVGLVAPGIYRGFHVSMTGLLSPGILLTSEGVRIEETEPVQLTLTPNQAGLQRRDIVVCEHEYQPTVPAPVAVFRVITGTPAQGVVLPPIPAHATLIAICRMPAGASTWDYIDQNANPPELLFNAVREGWDHRIVKGGYAALWVRTVLVQGVGVMEFYMHPGTGLADNAVISWGSAAFYFSSQGTPAEIIRLADEEGKFLAENVEAALAELAGDNRTTQTVKANADAIALETTNRQNADGNLQTQINNHLGSSSAHNAANIPIADSGNRYTGTNVETALQEIAGAGRTNQTVKGNADAISNHIGNGTGAHAASAISTEAVSGSPFSLSAGQVQTALASIVAAINDRARKSGDTFPGAVTFQDDVTFDAGDGDYPDGGGVKFDEDIWFFRTVSSFEGKGIDGASPAPFNDSFGGAQFNQVGHHLFIPIRALGSCKVSRVRFYFQVPPDTSGRATLTLRVTSTPSIYSGNAAYPATVLAEHTLQTNNPANASATHWTTYQYELDCGDLFISDSDFTKMVFATILMTEDAGKPLTCPGVKVAYKRTKVAV